MQCRLRSTINRHAVSVGGRTSDPKRGSQQERESDFKLPLSFTHPHPRLVRSCDERSSTTHVPSSSYPHITPPPCAHHTNPPSLACIASTKACNTSSDDSCPCHTFYVNICKIAHERAREHHSTKALTPPDPHTISLPSSTARTGSLLATSRASVTVS